MFPDFTDVQQVVTPNGIEHGFDVDLTQGGMAADAVKLVIREGRYPEDGLLASRCQVGQQIGLILVSLRLLCGLIKSMNIEISRYPTATLSDVLGEVK